MKEVWILLLEKITRLINQANSLEEKKILVVKKINIQSVQQIAQNADINLELQRLLDSNELYEAPQYSSDTTTVMAIAICLADVEKVRLFLNYVPDLNDSQHFVWGYRQLYSYVHLVGRPYSHIKSLTFRDQEIEVILNNRSEILKELALKGADFNWTGHGHYCNPPLSACFNSPGDYHGFEMNNEADKYKYNVVFPALVKLFIMYGANPVIPGSSHSLSIDNMLSLIKYAAESFIANELSFEPAYLRLAPEVKACFSEVMKEHMVCLPRSQIKTLLMSYNRQQQANDGKGLVPDLAEKIFNDALNLAKNTTKLIVNDSKTESNIKKLCNKYGYKVNL